MWRKQGVESLPLYTSMADALNARLAAAVDAALTPDALVDSLRTAQESKRIHARCSSLSNWSELELAVQLLRRKIVAAFVAAGDVPHVPEDASLLSWDNGKVGLALALRDYAECPLPMPTAMAQVAPGRAACATLACPHCRRPLSLNIRWECTAVQGVCQSERAICGPRGGVPSTRQRQAVPRGSSGVAEDGAAQEPLGRARRDAVGAHARGGEEGLGEAYGECDEIAMVPLG